MLAAAKSYIRKQAASVVRSYPWIPRAATLVAIVGITGGQVTRIHPPWLLGMAAVLAFSSFVWGYSVRLHRRVDWPSLDHLQRRQYADVWDALATSPWRARAAACGEQEEDGVRNSASVPIKNLRELAAVNAQDDLLEIGCGVGRIGFGLAPCCRTWTGADMSANMLGFASERLRDRSNVRLVQLRQVGLNELESNSFDLVYSTNVFAHLDEMDRWRYVADALRVLRPAGRLFIDNMDLESDLGWQAFAQGANSSQQLERPPYTPRLSTAAELTTYALRAGFEQVQRHNRPPLVIITAVKPRRPALSEARQ
jgi:ubiquinone/menaquinone biosynthesis C-methylase UbiE